MRVRSVFLWWPNYLSWGSLRLAPSLADLSHPRPRLPSDWPVKSLLSRGLLDSTFAVTQACRIMRMQ